MDMASKDGDANKPERISVRIKTAYPPSVNHYWRINRAGSGTRKVGVHVSPEGQAYRGIVMIDCIEQSVVNLMLKGRLKVHIKATRPDKRKRDLDNLLKATLDALAYARVYEDDSQFDDIRISWLPGIRHPGRLDILIEKQGGKGVFHVEHH